VLVSILVVSCPKKPRALGLPNDKVTNGRYLWNLILVWWPEGGRKTSLVWPFGHGLSGRSQHSRVLVLHHSKHCRVDLFLLFSLP
jgi:hypothetical protein